MTDGTTFKFRAPASARIEGTGFKDSPPNLGANLSFDRWGLIVYANPLLRAGCGCGDKAHQRGGVLMNGVQGRLIGGDLAFQLCEWPDSTVRFQRCCGVRGITDSGYLTQATAQPLPKLPPPHQNCGTPAYVRAPGKHLSVA